MQPWRCKYLCFICEKRLLRSKDELTIGKTLCQSVRPVNFPLGAMRRHCIALAYLWNLSCFFYAKLVICRQNVQLCNDLKQPSVYSFYNRLMIHRCILSSFSHNSVVLINQKWAHYKVIESLPLNYLIVAFLGYTLTQDAPATIHQHLKPIHKQIKVVWIH